MTVFAWRNFSFFVFSSAAGVFVLRFWRLPLIDLVFLVELWAVSCESRCRLRIMNSSIGSFIFWGLVNISWYILHAGLAGEKARWISWQAPAHVLASVRTPCHHVDAEPEKTCRFVERVCDWIFTTCIRRYCARRLYEVGLSLLNKLYLEKSQKLSCLLKILWRPFQLQYRGKNLVLGYRKVKISATVQTAPRQKCFQ